jgi:hypothetical protein
LDLEEHVAEMCISKEEPFGEKRRRIPEELRAEVILVVQRRTCGVGSHFTDSQVGKRRVERREDSRSLNS